MVSSLKDTEWLAWLERLVEESAGSTTPAGLPQSKFYCKANEQPDHLVPEWFFATRKHRSQAGELFLNRSFLITSGNDLPAGVAPEDTAGFALPAEVAWVTHAAGILQPFWIEHEVASILAGMQPGDRAPHSSTNELGDSFAAAGIFVTPESEKESAEYWQRVLSQSAAQFAEKGYAPVHGLIHPFHVAALRRYYRHQIRTGQIRLGDDQSKRRYVAHNEPVAHFFHRQLTGVVSRIAGEPVKPSYVYMAAYQPGAELSKHTDREQCQFSITMCVDYSPEPKLASPWPIHLQTPQGTATVFQAIGDALFYRGCDLPHFRHPLPAGHSSTSIFYHYVRESFAGKLD